MVILISRILVGAVFASLGIALASYVTAKIREKYPSKKNINKRIEKQQTKFDKKVEKEEQLEVSGIDFDNQQHSETIKYGNGIFICESSDWKDYIKKLIVNSRFEETKKTTLLSNLKIDDKDGNLLLECFAYITELNAICNKSVVVDGMVAPFKDGDTARIFNAETEEATNFVYTESSRLIKQENNMSIAHLIENGEKVVELADLIDKEL